jgi:hypothetical protein
MPIYGARRNRAERLRRRERAQPRARGSAREP